MNAVALGENVRLHTGVPLVDTVTEVNTALKQSLHGNNGHCCSFWFPSSKRAGLPGVERSEFSGDEYPLRDALCPSRARFVAPLRHRKEIISQVAAWSR